MKKLIVSIFITLSFSGCSLTKGAGNILDDGIQSYNNVEKEIDEIATKYTETKEKVEETISDVNNAITQVAEAKEAIKEISE